MLNSTMLADYRQDMQHNHVKFFESVQSYLRPPSSSFSGSSSTGSSFMNSNGGYQPSSGFSSAVGDSAFSDDGNSCRARSGSGGSFFVNGPGKDDLEHVTSIQTDDFPPISTFHVASPSPRKQSSQHHYQQGPPRSNRFRRGGNGAFRCRANGGNDSREMSSQQQRKPRHDSYSSNESPTYGQLTIQQQAAINNEANNGSSSADFVGRYKTELCRPFMENGECKYGDKCQFAHGRHELKQMSRHPKYKTEYCRTFHTVGFCPYGPRCHFLHLLDLDNPASEDGQMMMSDEQGNGETTCVVPKHPQQLALFESGTSRDDSASPTTIDEPTESVFLSPSPAAVSPVSSLSTCSEAVGTASSSGIGLSSPNASVSSNSPTARNLEEPIIVNDAEFPPLRPLQTSTSNASEVSTSSSLLTTASNPPVDRLHLLTISTGHRMQQAELNNNRNSAQENTVELNFAQMQQQKRQQQQQLAAFQNSYVRRWAQQGAAVVPRSMMPAFASAQIARGAQFFPAAERRLPIFSSLAATN